MDSRVDFALDRGRVLAPNLAPGPLGPIVTYGSEVSRAGVTDHLARAATPATMTSLAQYQSRFLPSTMSMHSPGASFALMGGLLGGAAPTDCLKTLMPDMQQLWTPHSDGYPRFVINNTSYTPLTPLAPFLPTDTVPSLLPPGPADPAHCHRIYELQKDAFLASVAASQAGLYGIVPNSHPFLEQTSSPLQQPQPQVPALSLGLVKQEPRESGSSCQTSSDRTRTERPVSKASERRHLKPTAGGPVTTGTRRDHPKGSSLPVAGTSIINNDNSNLNNNNNNNSSSIDSNINSSGSGRNQSARRPAAVHSQSKAVDKKEALKSSVREQGSSRDRRLGSKPNVKQTEQSAESVLHKSKTPNIASLVSKSDSGKRPEATATSVKTPKNQTTKGTNNNCSQRKVSGSGKETVTAVGRKTAPVLETVTAYKDCDNVSVGSGKAGNTGKAPGAKVRPSAARLNVKEAADHSSRTSSGVSVDAFKKQPRDKGDSVKDGRHSTVLVEDLRHPQGPSSGSDVKHKATVSTTSSGTSASTSLSTSIVSRKVGTGSCSPSQVVPTLVTVTSSSCDVNTVTSVPVTSGGTHSVFACSKPVTSTSVTASSGTQAKNSSVTSQVATSALPYYHTLYSKSKGGGQGTTGVKKVHATTTFVPEVGTFKGPLIRNMSKGCPDSRAIKSEQPRSVACCREVEDKGYRSGPPDNDGSGEIVQDCSDEIGKGSDDDASGWLRSASPKRNQHGDRSDSVSYHEPQQYQIRPVADMDFPASLSDGCSSIPSSVPFLGGKTSTVGFQSSEDSSEDVALDFSMSKRSKEFAVGQNDRQSKGSDGIPTSVGGGVKASFKHSPGRSISSAISCVPKVCHPDPRNDPREAIVTSSSSACLHSLQVTRAPLSGHSASRQGASFLSPSSAPESENSALNLSKPVRKKKTTKEVDVTSQSKSSVGCGVEVLSHGTRLGSVVSQLVAVEKRCGSAPPRSSVLSSGAHKEYEEDEEVEEEENTETALESEEKDPTEHTASNIPVGIAVAQQRADGGRVDTRSGVTRDEDTETSRQLAHEISEREEYMRQQKSVLAAAAKPIPNTALPPNLVVTGGENSLTDDLRLRPLPNQWLAAGHGITASPWLPQNPFALHPTMPTSNAAFDPTHQPGVALTGGFKLAHDSLTGQLLIIPSGDLVDQNSLWSAFQSGATSQPLPSAFQPLALPLPQHAPVSAATSVPNATSTETDEQDNSDILRSEENNSVCEDDSSEETDSPEHVQQLAAFNRDRPAAANAVVSISNKATDNRDKTDAVNLNNAFVPTDLTAAHSLALQAAAAAAGIATPHFPFVFNPALLPLPPSLPQGEAVNIKTETPTVQSRGCSPIIMTPPPSQQAPCVAEGTSPTARSQKKVHTACASVQTSNDLDLKPADVTTTRNAVPSREQGIQTGLDDHLQPLSVICATPELQDLHKNTAPLGALAAAALVAEGKADAMGTVTRDSREAGMYNPFTDPQILQAADGLELLSTLAEKRPKCSSAALMDPKAVFPSPSDSFKSDTPLPCPELEDTSLGDGERSGDTTPRGETLPDISPKWGPPSRKDAGQSTSVAEMKLSPTGLTNMDALELDMRIQLAELQRQYRKKQRELAKLQPKKPKEDGVKRGRGRPRKRQIATGKHDDESSNSSGGKATKEGSVKRRRPAEELVDRVFRKLPPAKLGKLKMKCISLKHKRQLSQCAGTESGTASETTKKKSKRDTGNLFTNLESSFSKASGKTKVKRQSEEAPATVTSGLPTTPTTISPATLQSGLGLLANFATSSLSCTPSSSTFSAHKRRREVCSWDTGQSDTPAFGASPGHSPLNKRRESDTDNSDTANNGTCIKKRKPGRPRKCDPNKTTGFTETIWARQTGLLQLSDVAQGKTWVSKAEEAATTTTTTSTSTTRVASIVSHNSKLAASQASLAPLLLDEWSLRRSERIFLNDTSPLPSPSQQSAKDSAVKAPGPRDSRSSSTGPGRPAGGGGRGRPPGTGYKQRQRAYSVNAEKLRQQQQPQQQHHQQNTPTISSAGTQGAKQKVKEKALAAGAATSVSGWLKAKSKVSEDKRDKDHAKVQKARSLQELTQRVKRKYNKKLGKKTVSSQEESRKKRDKPTVPAEEKVGLQKEDDSSSEGDNVPLSSLRDRPVTPEPRSCVVGQEELQDGLNVLFFRDCLFYEGVVQAIQPPDIYGVVVMGQRGTRPHICSREEILRDAIMAVPPGSQRYVKEGSRVCAYWSQQFRCLYPGTVAKTSPNPHSEQSVNVEFDDGDSGRIPLNHIRLLPMDFPLVTEEPDPLLYPSKKRRRTISEDGQRRGAEDDRSLSGGSLSRRNSRFHGTDDTVSEDGSVFDTVSLKSNTSGKSSSRPRACKDDAGAKTRAQGKSEERSSSKTAQRKVVPSKGRAKVSGFDDNDSGENDSTSEEDEDSFPSDDEKKLKTVKRGRTIKEGGRTDNGRDRKKRKEGKAGNVAAEVGWRWDGPSTKRPGMRGKAKKQFYKSIARGSDLVKVGDSAVFLSTGRDHCPYIGRIESLWESWGGQMMVRVKWFYHPEETKGCKQLAQPKGALFQSPHSDENDVQTISHKCQVLAFKDYNRRCAEATRKGQVLDSNTYYLAGYYDPTINFIKLEPDVQ